MLGYSAAKGYDASLLEELSHYPANEDIVALVESHPALNNNRLCLVHDALCACLADGALADGEWKTVLKMAAKLDVAETEVIAIRDAIAAETRVRADRRRGIRGVDPAVPARARKTIRDVTDGGEFPGSRSGRPPSVPWICAITGGGVPC